MAFDGFTLKAVVQELSSCLIGGKIIKVFEPNSEEILLGIYSHGKQYLLSCNISFANYSMHLTTNAKPNPLSAPNFCMLLRKHCIGFRIKKIETLGLERIAILELEGYNELNDLVSKKLIIELMGKHSNIILVNQENRIIDSLKHLDTFSGSYRNVLPNYPYTFPSNDKLDIFKEDFEITKMEKELENKYINENIISYFLENYTGVSKTLLQHIISVNNISNEVTLQNFRLILNELLQLKKGVLQEEVSCSLFEKDYVLSKNTNNSSLKVNFFLDDFYAQKEEKEEFLQYRNIILSFIMKKLKNLNKKLDMVHQKLQECSKMEDYQLYGELLTSYLYQIDNNTHSNHIILENYYQENQPIQIPLDIALSPSENAKKYFKKYHKLKNTLGIVTEQKKELEKEMNYLESIVFELEEAKSLSDVNSIYDELQEANFFAKKNGIEKGKKLSKISGKNSKKKTVHSLEDFITCKIKDFTVLIGKNNRQNDFLTTKIAKPNDLWFHVKDMQGSHVVLVTGSKEPTQELINQCASIAAFYSKAKQSSNVPVDYTFAKFVKKPSKSKPGMVIYANQQTVNVQPQEP